MRHGDADPHDFRDPTAGELVVEVLSGARSGVRARFRQGPVLVGRSAEAGLRFDPEGDLEVSSRHALLVRTEGAWWIRDLESRNGTFVGARRVTGDHRLAAGDRIRFGPGGPEVAVTSTGSSAAVEPARRAGAFPRPTVAGSPAPPPAPAGGETPSGRIRRLDRENRTLRRTLGAAVTTVVAGVAVAALLWRGSLGAWERERAALLARTDSVLDESRRAVEALEGELGGLRAALEASRADVTDLSAAVRAAEARGRDDDDLARLRVRLQAAEAALARQRLAATLDFADIERRNRRALAMLFIEMGGVVSTATAFGVLPDGTLATARHAVRSEGGSAPARIGVQFADSRQVWRGRVLAVSEDRDLALVKVDDIVGATPVVQGVEGSGTPVAGAPVALLGFPLAEPTERPVPLVSAGVVRGDGPEGVRIQGYGAEGSSGSPVLDASGSLVAILYGGSGDGTERELVAVPAAELRALLSRVRTP